MNKHLLRKITKEYGKAGILAVGVYLGLQSLWLHRRFIGLIFLSGFLTSSLLLVYWLPIRQYHSASVTSRLDEQHGLRHSLPDRQQGGLPTKQRAQNALFTLRGHKSSVQAVFSPDGRIILTGSLDGTVKFWDAGTGQEKASMVADQAVLCATYSPDGRRFITGGSIVKVWDTATRRLLLTFRGHVSQVNCIACSPDGKRIASGGGGERVGEDDRILVWEAATGKLQLTIRTEGFGILSVAFSPDGKRLIIVPEAIIPIKIWDAYTGRVLVTLKTKEDDWGVSEADFSPDGEHIVTASMGGGGTASIWNARNGKRIRKLVGHADWVKHVKFSPDGKRVVTGSFDTTAKVWDTATGQILQTLQGHKSYVRSVAFSPNGKQVVTGGGADDKTAKVWAIIGE